MIGDLTHAQILLRLLAAAVLGSVVGLERERLDWAPGLRTHMLVSLGACLFMVVSTYGFSTVLARPGVVLDPSRVAAQVVTGVGFLGAGTILLRGEVVRGLTTAASLWTVAAVGMAVGGGLFREAIVTTVLVLLILAGIKPIERRLFSAKRQRSIVLFVDPQASSLASLEAIVAGAGLAVGQLTLRRGAGSEKDRVDLSLARTSRENTLALVESLRSAPGVLEVRVSPE